MSGGCPCIVSCVVIYKLYTLLSNTCTNIYIYIYIYIYIIIILIVSTNYIFVHLLDNKVF